MEIQFYHLTASTIDRALPSLLMKAYGAGYRIMIKCADDMAVRQFDDLLWTFDPDSFLPHGTTKGEHAGMQPIVIGVDAAANINEANLLINTDGTYCEEFPAGVTRVLDMFNGADEQAVVAARMRWKQYKEQGQELTYFKQQVNGGWKKEA